MKRDGGPGRTEKDTHQCVWLRTFTKSHDHDIKGKSNGELLIWRTAMYSL